MYKRHDENRGATLLAAVWLGAGLAACSASNDVASLPCDPHGPCTITPDGSSPDGPVIVQPTDAMLPDGSVSRSPLCGISGCYPGNPSACGATPPVDAGTRPNMPDADAADARPLADVCCVDGASDASVDAPRASSVDASSDAAGSRDAGGDIDMNDEPRVPESCYVRPSASSVITECAPVGHGASGDACEDSSDCGALLACVEVNQRAICRPFSCALPAQCTPGNFYQRAPLRVSGVTMPDVKVPVCLPSDNCELLKMPSPCPSGQVCAVVGSEGETSCVPPGQSKLGDPCDDETNFCAEGLICSKLKNQCLKICHIDAGITECPGGVCQGGNLSVPSGFGICFGSSPDGGSSL